MKQQRVHYALYEDMKKYVSYIPPNFVRDNHHTDKIALDFLRAYYNRHLPVDVTAWMRVNIPDENSLYAKEFLEQVDFIRNHIDDLINDQNDNLPMVISTYRVKSVKLPVYCISNEEYGVEIVLKNNFYDWKVSVKSEKPIFFDFKDLFDISKTIYPYNCDGFPTDKVYECYNKNQSRFTFSIISEYDLYTVIYLIRKCLGIR